MALITILVPRLYMTAHFFDTLHLLYILMHVDPWYWVPSFVSHFKSLHCVWKLSILNSSLRTYAKYPCKSRCISIERYRVQCDKFEGLWMIVHELISRLKDQVAELRDGVALRLSFMGPLPLQYYFELIDNHFEVHVNLRWKKVSFFIYTELPTFCSVQGYVCII